jgi:hypothetical protein
MIFSCASKSFAHVNPAERRSGRASGGRRLNNLARARLCQTSPDNVNGIFLAGRAVPNRRFQYHKRSQEFIRTHNETLSVSQGRARIVFDCRMADNPAMMLSTNQFSFAFSQDNLQAVPPRLQRS